MILSLLVLFVAALHFYFMVLEMFFWQRPLGRKTFGMTPEKAKTTAVLATNQGLYNGFLALGLVLALWSQGPSMRLELAFLLGCVITAGILGAITVSPRILVVQALPAALAIGALALS